MRLSAASATLAADAVCAQLDGGTLRIYTAPQPATPDTAVTTQTLLAQFTFATPAFAGAVDGLALAAAIAPVTDAPASGTASWCRALTAGGDPVWDGSIGTGADTDGQFSSVTIAQHGTIWITRITYTQPLTD